MDTIQAIKQRFEIIGNEPKLNRVEKAIQVAPLTFQFWLWVRVVSERKYSKIIHSLSHRKHGSTLP
jgi:hypothetical protein